MGFMRTKHDICWEMSSEWELKDDFVKSIYNVFYSWKGGVAPPEVGSTQPSNCSLQYRDMQAGTTCKHLTHSTPTREGFAVSQHIPCSPPKNQRVHHPEVSPGSSKCHSPPCPTPLYFFAVCHIKKKKKSSELQSLDGFAFFLVCFPFKENWQKRGISEHFQMWVLPGWMKQLGVVCCFSFHSSEN